MVQLEMRDDADARVFYAIEVMFSVLFALEVVFKMYVDWFWPYWSSLFNVFDLCIVLVTLVSLVRALPEILRSACRWLQPRELPAAPKRVLSAELVPHVDCWCRVLWTCRLLPLCASFAVNILHSHFPSCFCLTSSLCERTLFGDPGAVKYQSVRWSLETRGGIQLFVCACCFGPE